MGSEGTVEEVARLIAAAQRVLFITGAGISADSGLPTYRGVGGLYNNTETEEGFPIEVALSGSMLDARPDVAWKYILQIERACRNGKPNRGHDVIAALAKDRHVCVLTQNVDGFHRAAGSPNVIDIHGDVHALYCTRCDWEAVVENYAHIQELPPMCPDCGALILISSAITSRVHHSLSLRSTAATR
mgnify:CR=1 FL=1